MAVQPQNAATQPYFNKASTRPPLSADSNAPSNVTVTKMRPRPSTAPTRNSNYPTTDEKFAQGYQNVRSVGPGRDTNIPRPDQTQGASVAYQTGQQARRVVRNTAAIGAKKLRRKTNLSLKAWRKVKVSTANTWIGSWAVFWYLTFQLPLAVISVAGLGFAFAAYSALANIAQKTVGETIFFQIGGKFLRFASDIIAGAFKVAGISFDPTLLFILPFALIFVLGLLQLIIAWFVYSILGLRSLSGKSAGLKHLTFLIAGVGYAIPILNFFPLIFLWMAVVWWHPK